MTREGWKNRTRATQPNTAYADQVFVNINNQYYPVCLVLNMSSDGFKPKG